MNERLLITMTVIPGKDQRTLLTVQPLSELLGLDPYIYTSSAELADHILSTHEGVIIIINWGAQSIAFKKT